MRVLDEDKTILFEHRFWLQVLGDHGRMILNSLSPQETEEIRTAERFIRLFDELLLQARRDDLNQADINRLTATAGNAAREIRAYKLHLIQRHLASKININLPPTFINHMVNEVEEYLLILSSIMQNRLPVFNPIHLHLLWLLDGSGHASGIMSNLDMVEKEFIKLSRKYAKEFDELYLKAWELCGYMRSGLPQFPSLDELNLEADEKMTSFKGFLKEQEELVRNKRILGTLQPVVVDHMYREECYYLTKLSYITDVKAPECDPTKPREE